MKPHTKHILFVIGIGLTAYFIYTVFSAVKKAIAAGENAVSAAIAAPYNGLSAVWSAVTGLFSGTSATPTNGVFSNVSPATEQFEQAALQTTPSTQPSFTSSPQLWDFTRLAQ